MGSIPFRNWNRPLNYNSGIGIDFQKSVGIDFCGIDFFGIELDFLELKFFLIEIYFVGITDLIMLIFTR